MCLLKIIIITIDYCMLMANNSKIYNLKSNCYKPIQYL